MTPTCFTETNTIVERLADSDIANAGWQRDLWVTYAKLAHLCLKRDQTAEAKGSLRNAYDKLSGMKRRRLHLCLEDEKFLAWLWA